MAALSEHECQACSTSRSLSCRMRIYSKTAHVRIFACTYMTATRPESAKERGA